VLPFRAQLVALLLACFASFGPACGSTQKASAGRDADAGPVDTAEAPEVDGAGGAAGGAGADAGPIDAAEAPEVDGAGGAAGGMGDAGAGGCAGGGAGRGSITLPSCIASLVAMCPTAECVHTADGARYMTDAHVTSTSGTCSPSGHTQSSVREDVTKADGSPCYSVVSCCAVPACEGYSYTWMAPDGTVIATGGVAYGGGSNPDSWSVTCSQSNETLHGTLGPPGLSGGTTAWTNGPCPSGSCP
jgi:hypothetical protein